MSNLHLEKVIIRESTLSDANEVAAIHVKSWQQSYRNIIDEHYLKNISFSDKLELRNKILQSNDPNQIHVVAVYEEKIIGFCDEMDIDQNTWLRARAWALWKATFELCQITDKTSPDAEIQKRIIDEVING